MLVEFGEPPPVASAEDVDTYDPGRYQAVGQHGLWRLLRATQPVRRDVAANGTPYWSFFRYHDCDAILKDAATFTSECGTILASVGADDPAGGKTITLMDPPGHTQLRRPASRCLGPATVRSRAEEIRRSVAEIVETVLETGTVDMAEVLRRLPMAVAGPLTGIAPEHWDSIAFSATASVAPDDPVFAIGRDAADTLRRAHHRLFSSFADTIQSCRARPGLDLVSELLVSEVGGRRLDDQRVLLNCYSFILGANATTPHVAAHLLIALADRPALWQEILDAPDLIESLIEEGVRWSSPTNHLIRRATRDVELAGVAMRESDWVCAWVASANRDEAIFADPYHFDARRSPNPHLGFGAGPHYCIGAPSSRLALRALLGELARQRVRFEVVGPPGHLRSNWINGITTLPMRFLA